MLFSSSVLPKKILGFVKVAEITKPPLIFHDTLILLYSMSTGIPAAEILKYECGNIAFPVKILTLAKLSPRELNGFRKAINSWIMYFPTAHTTCPISVIFLAHTLIRIIMLL